MREVVGFDRFGITLAALRRLRGRIGLRVNLRAFEVSAAVARLPAPERHPFLRRQARRWVDRLNAAFPAGRWKVVGEARGIPYALEGRIAAAQAARVARQPGVQAAFITSIPGRRPLRRLAAQGSWFCVRGLVAIQIEGLRVGMQTVEDRFVLIRARSAVDARRRLGRQWREYARPYLNSSGHLVRWQLEKVVDVYDVGDGEVDPNGTEVYSKLGRRRLRPKVAPRSGRGRPARR
jgi:Domain of unknown function (DUF4288)